MRKLACLFLIFIQTVAYPCLLSADNNKKYDINSIPFQLLENADAVIRLDDTRFEIKDVGHGIEYHHRIISILNLNGDKLAEFVEPYDKFREVKFKKACLYNSDGVKIKEIRKDDIRDYATAGASTLYSDTRIIEFSPAWGQYPYTIEYSWEIHYDGLFNYPNWIPVNEENLAVEFASYKVSFPENLNIRYKEFNVAHDLSKNNDEHLTNLTWQIDSIQALNIEIYEPEPYNFLPMVILAPELFEIEGINGNMTSWSGLGSWLRDLKSQKKDELSLETQNTIKELIKDIDDKKEKITKIYEFMQSRTRYVSVQLGLGGWRPFPAAVVDKNGYGDCKALSNYLQALLSIGGIPSNYCLIHGGQDPGMIFPDFPYNGFNHVIICVPLGKDTMWLECTSQTNPAGFTGGFTDKRYALVIGADGGTLVHTNFYSALDNSQKLISTVTIDNEGNATAEMNTIYKGCQYNKRGGALSLNAEDQKKYIYEHTGLQNFDLVHFKFSQVKDVVPIVSENLEFKIRGYASTGGNRTYFIPNLCHRWKTIPSKVMKRKTDILVRRPFTETDSIIYIFPEEMDIEYLPENLSLITKFGTYSIELSHYANKLIYQRKMILNEGKYSVSDYSEFANFLKQVAISDEEKIVLKKH